MVRIGGLGKGRTGETSKIAVCIRQLPRTHGLSLEARRTGTNVEVHRIGRLDTVGSITDDTSVRICIGQSKEAPPAPEDRRVVQRWSPERPGIR